MTDEPKSDRPSGSVEGYTKEEPAQSEIGEPGTPGAGMSPAAPHSADVDLVEQGEQPADPLIDTAEHDSGIQTAVHTQTGDDEHGHAEPVLGPIDVGGWVHALVGVAAGLVVVIFFWLAIT